jgi:hypothetical protein
MHACKIKETANGGWCGPRRETRQAFEVFVARRGAANGEVDDEKATARLCENETQEVTDKKAKEALSLRSGRWHGCSRLFHDDRHAPV